MPKAYAASSDADQGHISNFLGVAGDGSGQLKNVEKRPKTRKTA